MKLLVLIFIFSIQVFVQTNDDAEIYLIAYQFDDDSEKLEARAQAYLAELERTFKGAGIQLEFQELVDEPAGSDVIALLRFEDENAIWILPLIDNMKPLSAALQSAVWMDISADIQFATTILEYAIQGCKANLDLEALSFYRGNCLLLSGDVDRAIDEYENLPLLSSTQQIIGTNLIWALLQVGQSDRAFETLDLAYLELEGRAPDQVLAEFFVFRAQMDALVFDYDQAVKNIDRAVVLDPENPERYVQRGQIIMLLYEWDRVEANYTTAIELDPDYAPAYYYRGILYYSVLQRELALSDFEYFLKISPDGELAEQARHFVDSIMSQLDALNQLLPTMR